MSSFSDDWLALREPYDARARNAKVLAAVAASFEQNDTIQIVDLGCGTGSTMRALSPLLAARQKWRLVDNDTELLAKAIAARPLECVAATAVALDLNRDLEAALDGPINLVTTSALLDLVSEKWLERLAMKVAARSIPFYAALSYDGRIELTPVDPFDTAITAAVNAHQRTDKSFGPALGSAAAAIAITLFQSHSYALVQGASDWVISSDDCKMQSEVLAGWAKAAAGTSGLTAADASAWLTRRRDAVDAKISSIRVGHIDVFAVPMRTR
ncbi:MAG: class I SAM-dependent methyltransferase [Pseudolabrys sp.]